MSIDNEGFTEVALGTEGAHRAFANAEPQKHGLFAQFYMHPKQNAKETLIQGRPIYDETEYIRIMVPGDKSSIVERPVRLGIHINADNIKFSVEYEMFKQNKDQQVSGTPLEEWPPISRSQVKEMEYFNVRTVEQLAGMGDAQMQQFMGLGSLRELARRFIQHAEGAAPLSKMQAALDESTNTQTAQAAQIDAMAKELAALKAHNGMSPQSALSVPPVITSAPAPKATPAPTDVAEDANTKYAAAPIDLTETAGSTEEAPEVETPAPKLKKKAKRSIAT
tara:strand:- start:4403 stop:5239 length:837 start_codon:yes stop_codon:yes gene_type:complete